MQWIFGKVQHTAPCPRCGTRCPTGHSNRKLICTACNLTAVRCGHDRSFSLIIETVDGIRLRGSSIRYNGGTLRIIGGAVVRIDREMNIHVNGGYVVSMKGFNNVKIENCSGGVYVKRCNFVHLNEVGYVSLRQCQSVIVESSNKVFVERCNDVRIETAVGGCAISATRCRNVNIAGGGKTEVARCDVVRLTGRTASDVRVKRCKAFYVEAATKSKSTKVLALRD